MKLAGQLLAVQRQLKLVVNSEIGGKLVGNDSNSRRVDWIEIMRKLDGKLDGKLELETRNDVE